MPHRDEEYNTWLDVTLVMPEAGRMYWVSDGKDISLAKWNIANMCWIYKYMYSCFKPTCMMPIKLEKPIKFKDKKKEEENKKGD